MIVDVWKNGQINIKNNISFNNQNRDWIESQFSAFDGSNITMNRLIKNNMNDESSFKHIETSYVEIYSEDVRDRINSMIANIGYSVNLNAGDLYITTTFSGKNAFGGTVKNTAIGIIRYGTGNVTLIDIVN